MPSAEHAIADKASAAAAVGGFRHTVLLASKRFKSSWVDLGKLLTQVRDQALFEQWGFESFDGYCMTELRIRKQTALKLTRSFSFLDRHEPKAVEREDIAETAPPWEVVQVLADAEDRGQLSTQEYKSIRDSIWSDKPVSEMKREVVERFPAPEPESRPADDLKRLAGLAKKLAHELKANKKVPRSVVERAFALMDDVEALGGEAQA